MSTSVTNNADDHDPTEANISRRQGRSGIIKNRLKRQLLYRREKLRKAKERRERKENRKRKAEQLGEDVRRFMYPCVINK